MTKEEILNNCGQNLSKGTKITKEEILKIAQECNLLGMRPHLDGIYSESLEAFAKLIAEKEREECAKVCEMVIFKVKPIYCVVAENCVKVIRARGQE